MAQSLGKFEMRSSSSGIHWNSARAGGVPIAPAPPSGAAASVPQLNNPFNINHTSEPDQVATESNLGFPVRLHYMLTDIHKEGSQTNIVSWQPHGRCFVVHDKKQFVEKVLSMWFRQSKWASFQRQLNMYGFKRISSGPDKGGYYHPMFLQNSPQMAQNITRHKLKGTGPRRPAQPDQEPNFYAMPLLVPEQSSTVQDDPSTLQHTDQSSLYCGPGMGAGNFGAAASNISIPPSSITLRNSLGALESLFMSAPSTGDDEETTSALDDPNLWRYIGNM